MGVINTLAVVETRTIDEIMKMNYIKKKADEKFHTRTSNSATTGKEKGA